MYIRDNVDLRGNLYVATVDLDHGATTPVSPVEEEKLAQFGQLLVNVGGALVPQVGTTLTLPDRYLYLPREFPVQKTFSLDDYPSDAATYASLWVTLVRANINTALTDLLAKTAVVGEHVNKLPA